jgi:TonB family protein
MPITQIPFQDPVAPPEKPEPEQLGPYDQLDWEAAYRELDARVPHLIIQLQDDLQRSRKREAVWLSVIVHLLLFIALWNLPLIEKTLGWHRVAVVPVNPMKDQNTTFLALPPDLQKTPHRPNTNILSDKDRIAMTRHPELDPKELRKVLASPNPGTPGMRGPREAQPAPQQQAMAPNQAPTQQPPQQAPPQQHPQFQTNQTAQLQTPPQSNSFSKYMQGMSAGSAIQQATQAAAARRAGGGGDGGDFGIDVGRHGGAGGSLEIVSDTRGVDFAAYLARIHDAIQRSWSEVLPPSFYPPIRKQGKLLIQFTILKDGSVSVTAMALLASSGDTALDRAAWAGIVNSSPLPPLPKEFLQRGGQDLTLRGLFLYNMDTNDVQ